MNLIVKTIVVILLLISSHVAHGQDGGVVFPRDSAFKEYEQEIMSLERSYMDFMSLLIIANLPDTVSMGVYSYCEYDLKYIRREGAEIRTQSKIGIGGNLCDFVANHNRKPSFNLDNYRLASFGDKYIIVFYSLPTGIQNYIHYYFERRDDADE